MKKFIYPALALISAVTAVACTACAGTPELCYKLSEDGTYYIVSDVLHERALSNCEIPAVRVNQETGEELPVKVIGEYAFMGCMQLSKITIPDSVTRIEAFAFQLCGFQQITLPQGLTFIGNGAFSFCEYLTEITVPQSVTEMQVNTFAYCCGLKKAVVEANITDLPALTFANSYVENSGSIYTSTSLTEVHLPATVKKINSNALEGNFLQHIYYGGSEEQWDELYFYTRKTGENGEINEVKVEKEDVLLPAVQIHFAQ